MPFYASGWDPILISSQIVTMQASFYLAAGLFMHVLDMMAGTSISVAQFFSYEEMGVTTAHGWMTVLSYLFSSILGAVCLLFVVERAKKCLDFTATVYIVHLIVCIIVGGFPLSFTWWVVNVLALICMDLLGEFICMRKEMRDIPRNSLLNDDTL
eukprot:TRINITY_DN35_c0_g1_i1.p1 TRINITY_DN35_c0_g1~~TRINITY_DN35_c0_g1_i1.p1  ORF type:complete len:155 (-),score=23.29 TRINITY_DN35_c0_g1_i1:666-1130(-)